MEKTLGAERLAVKCQSTLVMLGAWRGPGSPSLQGVTALGGCGASRSPANGETSGRIHAGSPGRSASSPRRVSLERTIIWTKLSHFCRAFAITLWYERGGHTSCCWQRLFTRLRVIQMLATRWVKARLIWGTPRRGALTWPLWD